MSAKALIHQGDWADCLLMSLCHVRMLECFQHALFLPPSPPLEIVLSRTGVVRPAHRPKRGRTYFHLHFHPKIRGLSALSRRGTFRILEYRIDILYIPCLTTEGKTPYLWFDAMGNISEGTVTQPDFGRSDEDFNIDILVGNHLERR